MEDTVPHTMNKDRELRANCRCFIANIKIVRCFDDILPFKNWYPHRYTMMMAINPILNSLDIFIARFSTDWILVAAAGQPGK
jgi:hypothetical protein